MQGLIYIRYLTAARKLGVWMDRVLERSTRLKTRQLESSRESVTESLCLLDHNQKQGQVGRGHFSSKHKGQSQKLI